MSFPTYRQAGQWWSQPNPRLAYYCCLRWIYEMPAQQALQYIRETDGKYPGFIDDFMGTLKQAINP